MTDHFPVLDRIRNAWMGVWIALWLFVEDHRPRQ